MERLVFSFFFLFVYLPVFSQYCGERPPTMTVLINTYNQLFVECGVAEISELKDMVKEFIANPNDNEMYADKYEKEIPFLGKMPVSKGVISIQCDRGTAYEKYIEVQNEVERAFNELRNELALAKFKLPYKRLPKEKQRAINAAIPKSISEAEPRLVRNEKWELVPNTGGWGWY